MVQIIANSNWWGGGVWVYKYKGSVDYYEDLPTSWMKVWDTYNVVNAFTKDEKEYPAWTNVAWTGTEWDALWWSVDLSIYQKKLVEWTGIDIDWDTNEISVDTTVIATKQDLTTKQDTISDLDTIRQWAAKWATSIQPNDNISQLNNNAWYITWISGSDVTNALWYTPYNSTNPSWYIDKDVNDLTNYTKTSDLPDFTTYQLKSNMVTSLNSADDTHYPTAKAVKDAISSAWGWDVSWPSSSVDGHLAVFDWTTGKIIKDWWAIPTPTTVVDDLSTQSSTSALSANQGYVLKWYIDAINWKIPSEASSSNKLADKNYVDDSINQVAAYYITKNASWAAFATKAELLATTTFYSWWVVRVPTRNDYCIVLADETHSWETTRYSYQWSSWEYQYTVNETALTQAQLNALNSWITSGKVSTYDGYATNKQDKLVSWTNIKTVNGTSILGSGDIVTPNTTYSDATQSVAWLMSASDKAKLDGIEAQAQKNTVTGVKGSAESTYRTGTVDITPANLWLENKAEASGGTDVSLVTTGDKYNWNNKADTSIVNNAAYWSSWDWDSIHAPSKDAVYDKLKDLTDNKQDKLVNQTNIKSINGNSLLWSGDLEIAGWHDYSWKTKTWASFEIDLRSYIEPSQNFTVNLPDELEDGMEYVLRCVNGATAYTMTLGTGFTNPRNVSLSLNSYASDQFVFVAINGELELQPEPQLK